VVRNLGSLLLALVAAPLGFVLIGRGLGGLAQVASEAATADRTDYFAIATNATAVGLAGLIIALLTMARFSPLGPGLAGAGYLTIGIWALVDRQDLLATIPVDLVGLNEQRFTAATAVALLVAVPLLVTVFIPRRWRAPVRPATQPAPQPEWRPPPTQTLIGWPPIVRPPIPEPDTPPDPFIWRRD
jgi:hypothetical protein